MSAERRKDGLSSTFFVKTIPVIFLFLTVSLQLIILSYIVYTRNMI